MDFFARQQRVRRVSTRLVFLFIAAVIGIVATIDLVVVWVFGAWHKGTTDLVATIVVTSLITLVAIALAALTRTASLRGGGGTVARELGGVLVPPDTTDPRLRRLRNVVEEIAIASGVTVPEVYLLPNEEGINAFAAGWSPADAAVAVTRGALERLNRDELQGVIAHEFSHVVNGDMRLNIRLMGLLFGLLFLAVIGRTLLFFGGGRGRSNGKGGGSADALPLVGLALVAAGFIGVFAGRIIQASVSRQREYLADASAVQFTRQTSGIAGALKKIGGLESGSKLKAPRTEEVGHMLFGPGLRISSLFATHPPLTDRIKALDPSFDPAELNRLAQRWAAAPPSGMAEDAALGLAEPTAGRALPDVLARTQVPADAVISQIAAPTGSAYGHAGSILGQLPADLLARARRTDQVATLLFGLLMAREPDARTVQHTALAQQVGPPLADAAWAAANDLAGLHPLLRLPLAELCFPALRQLPQAEQQRVLAAVHTLINSDARITVFEYCLSRTMYGELTDVMTPHRRHLGRHSLSGAASAVTTLVAVLAQAGNADPDAAARAFGAGIARTLPGRQIPYAPPARGVLELEPLWATLDGLRPDDKSLLIRGVVDVINQDGTMTVAEMELLRTVCALLHCPLPPLPGLAFDTRVE